MLRKAMTHIIYEEFFSLQYSEEPMGIALSKQVIPAIQRYLPFYIGSIYLEDGRQLLTSHEATELCREVGVEDFAKAVYEILTNVTLHPTVSKILASHPLLAINQKDIMLLLAIAIYLTKEELLRQPIEDPINGSVMKSEDTFRYLKKCYLLFM